MAKVDAEKQKGIAEVLGIFAFPSVFGMKDGIILDNFVGGLPQNEVLMWCNVVGAMYDRGGQLCFELGSIFPFVLTFNFYRFFRSFVGIPVQVCMHLDALSFLSARPVLFYSFFSLLPIDKSKQDRPSSLV